MAFLCCVACGAGAWMAAWLLMKGPEGDLRMLAARRVALLHACRRGLLALAGTPAIEALLAQRDVRDVADTLERRTSVSATFDAAELTRPELVSALVVLLAAGCVAAGVLARSVLGALASLVVAIAGMHLWASAGRRRRAQELAQEMPGVLRTMATALESGHTLVQAVEYVGLHERGHAAGPFARASLRLRCGMSVDDALEELRRELSAPGVDLMVTALSISQRTGSPLRSLLRRSAVLVEQQGEFERMLAVRTAQVRLSVRIVCCLPPLMVLVLAIISPDFQEGLGTVPGLASLGIAACLDATALLIIRRIMEGVL